MTLRILGATATLALAVGGLTAAATPADATQHTTTTISTTVSGNGWTPNVQGPGNGSITGDFAPGNEDAAKFTVQGDGTIETLFGTQYIGTAFADVSGLSYDTYVQSSNDSLLAPSIGFEVWGGNTGAFLGSMVYEPYVGNPSQPVQTGVWQHWDATNPNAMWWSTKAILNPDGSVKWPAQQAHTLAEFEAAFAAYPAKYSGLMTKDGVKTYVGESVPSNDWNGFVGYVDNVHLTVGGANPSDKTWDFTTGIGPCAATVDNNTETYTLTQDCSTVSTINVPDGWTIDGNGHTLTAVEDAGHQNFPGPVLLSATGDNTSAATMNVENLTLTTSGFQNGQNSGGQLAGIKYNRAGGTVQNVTINGISHGNGVQEGIGLWVRNRDASGSFLVPPATVAVDDVTVTNYQKGGVILDGNLGFTLTNSTIGSAAGPTGTPLTSIAANAVQVSRDAHGTISGNTIGLNEYNPTPPPGDGSDATSILVYDARTVNIKQNVISGQNGDVGIDTYNDTQGTMDTTVNVSCNLMSRNDDTVYDMWGVGIAQYDDGSTPVDLNVSDTTFAGNWNETTSMVSFDDNGNAVFGQGAADPTTGACAPTAPTNVSVTGGDHQTDVTWSASTAAPYAPLTGYTVTATDENGNEVTHQTVGANATSGHLSGLGSGQDYTITVVANGGGGDSAPGTATLYATTLTLSPTLSTIVYGKNTTLNGQLSSDNPNAVLSGRQVTIQSSPSGSGTWTTLTTKSVASDGSFSVQVTPGANTDYRAIYAGAPDNSSTSATATVDVSMFVKAVASKKKIHINKAVSITGVVSPNHNGYQVMLQVQQGSDWVTLQQATLDQVSSYQFKWKPTVRGAYVLRVYAPGDATHLDGTSDTFKVKAHK